MLGLAGIPPFAGFFGKFFIFTEALQNGYFYTVLIAIINSIIGIYYYFKVILAMYGKPANETQIENPLTYQLVMWLCIGLSLILGILPGMLTDLFN
jgi:NADH-quinone oxidoreductase subunit N